MKTLRPFTSRNCNSLINQRGASLLEGLAYLGIAAIIILGAISLLTSAFSGARTNSTAEDVTAIRTNVKKLYMGQSAGYGTAGTDITAQLTAAKVFPASIVGGKNVWGGTVTVIAQGTSFDLAYTLVPEDVCINLISNANGWTTVKIDAGVATAVATITPAVASGAGFCTGGGTHTITWNGA